jgi:hypothetical protein
MTSAPWFSYPFLLFPKRILHNLERRVEAGMTTDPPNAWQLSLGVMRMWHRSLFRTETVGTSPGGTVRNNWRARLLHNRSLRLPCLLWEGAVAPYDMTGLASGQERIIKHLLGAHHDGIQFIFDLDLLAAHEGALEELEARTREVIESKGKRSTWLRDLTVYEGYHEQLLAATKAAIAKGIELSEDDCNDADISLEGYLRWCVQQPNSPKATLQAMQSGAFAFDSEPIRQGARA